VRSRRPTMQYMTDMGKDWKYDRRHENPGCKGEPKELALAELTQENFKRRLAAARVQIDRNREIQQTIMTQDEDYGVIPGTNKPTLLKPVPKSWQTSTGSRPRSTPDHFRGRCESPPIIIVSTCNMIKNGVVVTTGHGAANSWSASTGCGRGRRRRVRSSSTSSTR